MGEIPTEVIEGCLPKCPKCGAPGYPQTASFADIYEPEAVYDDPRAAIKQPTGYYICSKCSHVFLPEKKRGKKEGVFNG